jgi:hypothetical protein
LGSYETGMRVYFPGVVLTVDTSSDCHLSYKPLGKTVALSSLHYVQPWCPPVVYPLSVWPFWLCPILPATLCCPRILREDGFSAGFFSPP